MPGIPFDVSMSGLVLTGGVASTLVIDVPSRGVIDKIICQQIDGVTVALTVAIFNHQSVVDGEETSDSVGDETGPLHENVYRVTPDLSTATYGASGSFIFFAILAPGGKGFTYTNKDPYDAGREGIRPRRLYVRITPAGSGSKTFCLAVGGEATQ